MSEAIVSNIWVTDPLVIMRRNLYHGRDRDVLDFQEILEHWESLTSISQK